MVYVCVRDVVFYVCIVTRGTVGVGVWEVCVFRHADVLNAAFCITCSLVMLVEDERGDHIETYSRAGFMPAL